MSKKPFLAEPTTPPAESHHRFPQAPAPGLQEALGQSQANLLRYQVLFDFAPDSQLVTDLQAVIQQANHAAASMLSTPKEFLAGKPLLFFVAPAHRRSFTERLYAVAYHTQHRVQWEMTLAPPRGPELRVLATATAAPSLDPPTTLHWVLDDITSRKQAEESLKAERDFADGLIETAEAVIVVVDAVGRIVRSNPYLQALVGRRAEELEDQLLADLLVAEDRTALQQSILDLVGGDRRARGVHRLLTRGGQARTVAWSAHLLGVGPTGDGLILLVGNDVTELERVQQRAMQVERLAVIGQMTATLAHEGRNALQRAEACLTRLGWRLEGRPEELDLVQRARQAVDDLQRLFGDLRGYAAPLRLELRACDVRALWREVWAQVVAEHPGRDARLEEAPAGPAPECQADPFRLKQVFSNLLVNALDACPDPVRLTVACQETHLGDRPAVRITLRDNGPGFTPEARQRALEPFFTTKAKGTGLGLSIACRILEAHGGVLAIEASEGAGATLSVTLPRTRAATATSFG